MKRNKNKKTTILMFTYGTLMRGNHNNCILGKARFVCDAKIKGLECFGMPYGFPMVVKTQNNNNEIKGEIWEVEINQLPMLDNLEGYDEWTDSGKYLRRNTIALGCDNNKKYNVSYYLWNKKTPKGSVRVPSGIKWNSQNKY